MKPQGRTGINQISECENEEGRLWQKEQCIKTQGQEYWELFVLRLENE